MGESRGVELYLIGSIDGVIWGEAEIGVYYLDELSLLYVSFHAHTIRKCKLGQLFDDEAGIGWLQGGVLIGN